MHVTSLPSPYGVGDLGPEAYRFVDLLKKMGQGVWQILPLSETMGPGGNSPYHSLSAFAGNPYLISPDLLVEDGWLKPRDLRPRPRFPQNRVAFPAVNEYKDRLFTIAYERFKKKPPPARFRQFCLDNQEWLDDFALFRALKRSFPGKQWREWPARIRDRDRATLKALALELRGSIGKQKFLQFLFFKQWLALKNYCHRKGVRVFGDMPIYVEYDSVDVWKDPQIFKLGSDHRPLFVSGVPPDYFSKTGQLWGHPVYDWQALKRSGFRWWIKRLEQNLRLYDLVRIDHFRGLVAYWEVKAGARNAMKGEWVEAPASELFDAFKRHFSGLSIVAEDLGTITPDVHQVMARYGIPGMRVLLFAFGEDDPWHPYLPENFVPHCVAYTGTHDNNTVRGWFEEDALVADKGRLFKYLKKKVPVHKVHLEFIKMALGSEAELAIMPLQDVLGLGADARMNDPAKPFGNWGWRLKPRQLDRSAVRELARMVRASRRS